MEVLNVIAIIVAGLMVGSELSIAAFVHPTLDRLPDAVHLPAASALARVLGRFMPFWYILVFFVGVGQSVFGHHFSADQQPYCIVGKGHPACRLEDISEQMGPASPLACSAPHDSFRISNRWSR